MYIDVLIGVNIYINYFLLLASAFFLHEKAKRTRLCLGALIGALGCCAMFLDLPFFFLGVMIKAGIASLMVLTAFGYKNLRTFFFRTAVLTAVTFTLAGLMIAVKNLFSASFISVKCFSVYLDISPLFLITATVACYLLLTLVSRILDKRRTGVLECEVKIEHNGKTASTTGFFDTGNRLTEPFSGFPVLIADRKSVADVIPESFDSPLSRGMRLIPYSSLGGDGLLKAFLPDKVTVSTKEKSVTAENIYVAVADRKDSSALINPDIFS